jgi:hypothetical protein
MWSDGLHRSTNEVLELPPYAQYKKYIRRETFEQY